MKLYLGFRLDSQLTARIATMIDTYCARREPLEPVPADRIHITTLFLGDVPVATAKSILTRTASERTPFDVFIGAAASFPTVLYLSVDEPKGMLELLHRRQATEFSLLSGKLPGHTIYTPHVTLAKGRKQSETLRDMIDLAKHRIGPGPEVWSSISSLCLFHKSEILDEVQLQERNT